MLPSGTGIICTIYTANVTWVGSVLSCNNLSTAGEELDDQSHDYLMYLPEV